MSEGAAIALASAAAVFVAPKEAHAVDIHNGLCLDARGRTTGNGTPLTLRSCDSGAIQEWRIA
ncbi:hypothetical protein O1R50_02055 [Glycomyces luteolus]|uniref:Ricin B lectin domain-containing protein n=1 Tax=Glycomyces luteolus TaxID=2670330 RepID=A0A9X3P9J7_9ACTN|nr:hypothetical protein [Glycomyces luteolus]MDA1358384.1 hypothetical protein [Glycomyces luteolus]